MARVGGFFNTPISRFVNDNKLARQVMEFLVGLMGNQLQIAVGAVGILVLAVFISYQMSWVFYRKREF